MSSSSLTYSSFPRASFTWTTTVNLSYVVISWVGNTTVNWASGTSGNIYLPTTTYTTGDLSFNTLYTFALTPYNSQNTSGPANLMTIDTTPANTGIYASYATSSAIKLQWYGGKNNIPAYQYVKISRAVGSLGFVDLSTAVVDNQYFDYDLSGNTQYSYNLTLYSSGLYPEIDSSATQVYTYTTPVQAPKDLAVTFYDTSAITLSFTEPKNTYSTFKYYTVFASDASNNIYYMNGASSPLTIKNLTSGTTYSCYARVVLDYSNNLVGTTNKITQRTSSQESVLNKTIAFAIVSGGDVSYNLNYVDPYNSVKYSYFLVKDFSNSITNISYYNVNSSLTSYFLAVGGGSSGVNYPVAGGGGGGQVLQNSINISSGDKFTISVGSGGIPNNLSYTNVPGSNTILNINNTIYSAQGGLGNGSNTTGATSGSGYKGGKSLYANQSAGGAGAGGVGGDSPVVGGGAGGPGVQYSYYGFPRYWFGGGGGGSFMGSATYDVYAGNGGIGGGGGGFAVSYTIPKVYSGKGDTNSIYPAYNSNDISNGTFRKGSDGAPNSGGGGGGGAGVYTADKYIPAKGGSGVVVVTTPQSLLMVVDDTESLKIHYKFDSNDITNNKVFNYATNNYDASINSLLININTNSTYYKIGSGCLYNSDSTGIGYVSLPSLPKNINGYSFSFWFYSMNPTRSNDNVIFTLYNGNVPSYGKIQCYIKGGSGKFYVGTSTGIDYSPFTVTANTWYHITWTITTWGLSTIYVNGGSSNGGYTYVDPSCGYISVPFNTDYSSIFGDYSNGFNNSLYGYLDDFRYYDKLISLTEITFLYNLKQTSGQINNFTITQKDFYSVSLIFNSINTSYIVVKNITESKHYGPYIANNGSSSILIEGLTPTNTYQFVLFVIDKNGKQITSSAINTITMTGLTFYNTLYDSLYYYYKFDSGDVSYNNVFNYALGTYDASLSSYSGTIVPSIDNTKYISGNGSLSLNDTYKQQMYLANAFYPSTAAMTITFWFYDKGESSNGRIFNFDNGNTGAFINLSFMSNPNGNGTNSYSFQSYSVYDQAKQFYSKPFIRSLNTWYHIALVISNNDLRIPGQNNYVKTYINGVLYSTDLCSYCTNNVQNPYLINSFISKSIASDATSGYGWMNSYLDDFRLYNGKSLNSQQILQIYNEKFLTNVKIGSKISVSNISSSSLTISWIGINASYYLIYNQSLNIIYGQDYSITSSPYVISNLLPGFTYKFYIIPFDSNYNQGSCSKAITVTTSMLSNSSYILPYSTNLTLWLDAQNYSSMTFNASNYLTQWNDRSGNGYNAAAYYKNCSYSSNGLSAGCPAIQFKTSIMYSSIPAGSFSNGMTVIIVYNTNVDLGAGTSVPSCLFSRSISNMGHPINIYANVRYFYNKSVTSTVHLSGLGNGKTIYTGVLTPTLYSEYSNNNLVVSPTSLGTYLDDATNFYIGGRDDNYSYTGSISEVLVYNQPLEVTNLNTIWNYLSYKWGINLNTLTYKYNTFEKNTIDKSGVSTDKLLFYYPLNNDIYNYAMGYPVNDASAVNGATILNGSLNLIDTNAQYIKLPNFTNTTNGMTISFWFKVPSSQQAWARFFDCGNGAVSSNVFVYCSGNTLGYGGRGTNFNITGNSVMNISYSTWYHYAQTILYTDMANSLITIYINGVSVTTFNGYPDIITRTQNFLGKSDWSNDPYITCNMGDFRYYNRTLSAAEVSTISNYGKPSI